MKIKIDLKNTIFILFLPLFFGCGSSQPDFPVPGNTVTWLIYEGTLPCSDCSEIKTQLELKIPSEGSTASFIIKQAYIGTKEGDQAIIEHGKYNTLKGKYRDKDVMIYDLQFNKENKRNYFARITEDTLVMLDQSRKEIVTDLNNKLVLTGKKEE